MIAGWPPMVYVALFTLAPSGSVAGVEVTTDRWTNYQRVAIPNDATHWAGESYVEGGVTKTAYWNNQNIDFGVANVLVPGPTIVAFALMRSDTLTDGQYQCIATLLTPWQVTNGRRPMFRIGSLIIAGCA